MAKLSWLVQPLCNNFSKDRGLTHAGVPSLALNIKINFSLQDISFKGTLFFIWNFGDKMFFDICSLFGGFSRVNEAKEFLRISLFSESNCCFPSPMTVYLSSPSGICKL